MNIPKIIVADIDFTLTVKRQPISKRNAHTIAILRQNGILFGPASGRPVSGLVKILKEWEDLGIQYDFAIASNGCELIDNIDGKTHEYYFMQPEQIREAIEYMRRFQGNPQIIKNNYALVGYLDEEMIQSKLYSGMELIVCENSSYSEMVEEPIGKIMFRVNEDNIRMIQKYCDEHPLDSIVGFRTSPGVFEFTDKRANKGVALKNFCNMHDIDLADCVAFGDTTNDNEMLKAAGIGVCMLNGTDDTKAIADCITDLDVEHDGFSDFIEKNIFIPNNIKF